MSRGNYLAELGMIQSRMAVGCCWFSLVNALTENSVKISLKNVLVFIAIVDKPYSKSEKKVS